MLRQSSATETDGIATPDTAIRTALADSVRRETLLAIQHRGEIRVLINDRDCQQYLARLGLQPCPPKVWPTKPPRFTRWAINRPCSLLAVLPTFSPSTNAHRHYRPQRREQLVAAEEEYPAAWIEAAFDLAAEHNARIGSTSSPSCADGSRKAVPPKLSHHATANETSTMSMENLGAILRRIAAPGTLKKSDDFMAGDYPGNPMQTNARQQAVSDCHICTGPAGCLPTCRLDTPTSARLPLPLSAIRCRRNHPHRRAGTL